MAWRNTNMGLRTKPTMEISNDNLTTLDWSAIGRLVRRRTLESVTTHFRSLATVPSNSDSEPKQHGMNRDSR